MLRKLLSKITGKKTDTTTDRLEKSITRKGKIDYNKLYEKSDKFKDYVDKCMIQYNKTLQEALENAITKSYAEYLIEKNDSLNGVGFKEIVRDCNCS